MNKVLKKNRSLSPLLYTGFELSIRMITTICLSKFISVRFGAEGLSFYAFWFYLFSAFGVLASASVGSGFVVLLASYNKEQPITEYRLRTSIVSTALIGLFFVVPAILFVNLNFIENPLSISGADFSPLDLLWLCFSIFMYYVVSVYYSYLNALRKIEKLAKVRIFISFFSTALFILVSYFYGLKKSIYLISSGFIFLGIYLFILNYKAIYVFIAGFTQFIDSINMKYYFLFGLSIGLVAFFGPTIQMFIRHILVHYSSVTQSGLWEGLWRISDAINTITISFITVFLVPYISSTKIKNPIKHTFLFLMIILFLFSLVGVVLYYHSDFFLFILYNKEFVDLNEGLFLIVFGTGFRVLGAIFNMINLIKISKVLFLYIEFICAFFFVLGIYSFRKNIQVDTLALISFSIAVLYCCLSLLGMLIGYKNGKIS